MANQTVPNTDTYSRGRFFDEDGNQIDLGGGVAELTPLQHRREKDRIRTACQAPISGEKLCVLYVVNRREKRSPWFYRSDRARQALALMQAKYGERNCILYRD